MTIPVLNAILYTEHFKVRSSTRMRTYKGLFNVTFSENVNIDIIQQPELFSPISKLHTGCIQDQTTLR